MNYYSKPIVYGVKNKNEYIREVSRSGGVFTAVSDYVLEQKGVVYGCIMKNCYEAVHVRAENKEERNKMRGSKYIQSRIGNVYCEVKADLASGRLVMFSGTSCQIAALQSFLGKEYDSIIYVDIICHGVPSSKVWNDYVNWQEKKNKAKCIGVDFRNKHDFGWAKHKETLCMKKNNNKEITVHSDVFSMLFKGNNILRPSCFKCPYKSIIHPGDITLGDFWGIDKIEPQFNDNKGVSLLLINNERGEAIIEKVKEQLIMLPSTIEDVMQPSLKYSYAIPEGRDEFWDYYKKNSFKKVSKRYADYGNVASIKRMIRKATRKIRKILNIK